MDSEADKIHDSVYAINVNQVIMTWKKAASESTGLTTVL